VFLTCRRGFIDDRIYWTLIKLVITLHKPLHDTLHLLYCIIFDCRFKRLPQFLTTVNSFSESEADLLYDWRFTANQFVLATSPLRLRTSNFIFQLNTRCYRPYVTSPLTRGWVCRLQLLLVFDSTVILKSESDHILLSQIRDSANLQGQVPVFTSHRNRVAQLYPQAPLRLTGLRWRYSNPPPSGWLLSLHYAKSTNLLWKTKSKSKLLYNRRFMTKIGWRRGKDFDFYSGGVRLESRSRHRLLWESSWFSSVPPRK
jgi:hypothetical protein